ncbi:MAG: hypothetical protein AABX13_01425 [Nanoarchaeota archaeon]
MTIPACAREGQPTAGVDYKSLMFEPRAYRKEGETDYKALLTYDISLARLRQAGLVRHPRPAEVFSLLIDDLEGKLTPEQRTVANNMLSFPGEWVSLAMERQGNVLVCYFEPEGLVWRPAVLDREKGRWTKNYYERDNFRFTERKEYILRKRYGLFRIPAGQEINLNQFSDELVTALFSRPFKDLPLKMRKDINDRRVKLRLPPEGELWPVARWGYLDNYYALDGNTNRTTDRICYHASRGVVPSGSEG